MLQRYLLRWTRASGPAIIEAQAAISRRIVTLEKAGSLSPVEWCKCVGQHERHNQYTRPKDKHVPGITQIEAADTTDEQIADGKVEEAHRTLTIAEDKPTPGGEAKGLWKAFPDIPLPRWGRVFVRNAPPKKYAK